MATKAERFKAQAARDANPPKAKRPARPRRDSVVDTSNPGVSATDRRARRGPSGSRNTSKRAGTKGGAALEDTITGEPSRKSTRRSTGGAKRTANLELRAKRRTSSAKARASRSTAKKSPAKPTAKKAPAAKKTPAKKAPVKKAPAKKAPAKKAPAKKAPAIKR